MTPALQKLLKQYEEHCRKVGQATTININEKPVDKINRMQHLEGDYVRWFEWYFPMYAKSPCAPYHIEISDLIINNKILDILLEIYRSGAKSVHADMCIYTIQKICFLCF